jgi:alanine-synthesizing transaminase
VLVKGLHEAGWMVDDPRRRCTSGRKIPEAYERMGSLEFAKKLLAEAKVSVSPGIGFGEFGDQHVRFAMIENEAPHAPGDPRHQADVPRRRS